MTLSKEDLDYEVSLLLRTSRGDIDAVTLLARFVADDPRLAPRLREYLSSRLLSDLEATLPNLLGRPEEAFFFGKYLLRSVLGVCPKCLRRKDFPEEYLAVVQCDYCGASLRSPDIYEEEEETFTRWLYG
jgi:hypothetical protein